MKLKKIEDEYYLLDNSDLQTRDWALRPDGVILRMTDVDMIHYLDNESTATKKIIASSKKMDGIAMLKNLQLIELWKDNSVDIEKKAEDCISYSFEEDKSITDRAREKFVEGYNQCLEDNLDKKFSIDNMRNALTQLSSEILSIDGEINGPADAFKWIEKFITYSTKERTEWEVEVDMGLYPHPNHKFISDGKTYPLEIITRPIVDKDGYINILSIK